MTYIYNYAYPHEEASLCALEKRSFFGKMDFESDIIESTLEIDPSRSPFIRERIDVLYEGENVDDIIQQVRNLQLEKSTFKVIYVKNPTLDKSEEVSFKERRKMEREIGLHINGEAELLKPNVLFGVMNVNGRWFFGEYLKNKAVWLHHQKKPHSYSTALSTRVARAVSNIAVPFPVGIKAIDPCCGNGTVLVEALSMGIDIVGSDINPLILPGTRENITHFGLVTEVTKKDIKDIADLYDVAIIDMPYNLCSVITPEEQQEMLESAGHIASKIVIVTIEPIDSIIARAGLSIIDRCVVNKGSFVRQVIVCK